MNKLFNSFVIAVLFMIAISGCSSSKKSGTEKGFVSIFDGKTLNGWEGDPKYWRVENGTLVGEVTPETILKRNTFIIWKGGEPGDFELKVEYRISFMGNSGFNYRSVTIDTLPFILKGYQADIDGSGKSGTGFPKYTGQNYEERGRTFLAWRGQRVIIEPGQKPKVIDSLGTQEELLKSIHYDDWNELHLVVKGNNLKHFINGTLMSEVTDNDTANRTMRGLIGVQVHVGPPMKVEYRNFRLRNL